MLKQKFFIIVLTSHAIALSMDQKHSSEIDQEKKIPVSKFTFKPIQPKKRTPIIDKVSKQVIRPSTIIYDEYGEQFDESFKMGLAYLEDPKLYCKVKNIPNQFLLYGEKGSGKSYLAALIAKKFRLPFLSIRGNELEEGLSGDTSKKISAFFNTRDPNGKTLIILVEEIDQVLKRRNEKMSDVGLSTVTSLLDELTRQETDPSLFTFMTTNHKDWLDISALSRFEKIEIKPLNDATRFIYIEKRLNKMKITDDKLKQDVVQAAQGLDRRDIRNALTTARMKAIAREVNQDAIPTLKDFIICLEQKANANSLSFGTRFDQFAERWNPRIQFLNNVISLGYNLVFYPVQSIMNYNSQKKQSKNSDESLQISKDSLELTRAYHAEALVHRNEDLSRTLKEHVERMKWDDYHRKAMIYLGSNLNSKHAYKELQIVHKIMQNTNYPFDLAYEQFLKNVDVVKKIKSDTKCTYFEAWEKFWVHQK